MTNSVTPDLGAADVGREVQRLYTNLDRWTDEQILGLGEEWDGESLRLAYHRSVRRYHPDAAGNADDTLKQMLPVVFMRVVEAYQALRANVRVRAPHPPAAAAPSVVASASPAEREWKTQVVAPPVPAPEAVEVHTGPSRGEGVASRSQPPEGAKHAESHPRVLAFQHAKEAEPQDVGGTTLEEESTVVVTALAEARRLAQAGDAEGVIGVLHKVLARADEPHRREIQLELARAYVSDARWRRYGLALLRDMTTADPDDASALAILGGVYYREGLLARAKATLERALAVLPSLPEASSTLVLVERALEHRAKLSGREPIRESSGLWARLSQSLQRPAASTVTRSRRVPSAA